jgi:hypothetical protein
MISIADPMGPALDDSAPTDRRMSSSELRIGASGLRSSWASMARNSFLRRSASDKASS